MREVTVEIPDEVGILDTASGQFIDYEEAVSRASGIADPLAMEIRLWVTTRREGAYLTPACAVEVTARPPLPSSGGARVWVADSGSRAADDNSRFFLACQVLAFQLAEAANEAAGYKPTALRG